LGSGGRSVVAGLTAIVVVLSLAGMTCRAERDFLFTPHMYAASTTAMMATAGTATDNAMMLESLNPETGGSGGWGGRATEAWP
jgi:hypothetical protein